MKSASWVWKYVLGTFASFVLVVCIFGAAGADLRQQYGDGLWHDVGAGWQYRYVSSIDSGYWLNNGVVRFGFEYAPGRWWQHGTTWSLLSGNGFTDADFVGDGAFHDVSNGWLFKYVSSASSGYWNNAGMTRFGYDYNGARWWDNRNGWAMLGASGVSEAFLADGAWHDLNQGWLYSYNTAISGGYWNTAGETRFGYDYNQGRWWSYRNAWSPLGASGVSQSFIGNGAWHNLNNGWSYLYSAGMSQASWATNGRLRFLYDYTPGQWYDATSWNTIGAEGLSSAFLGDGSWHDLNNGGWSFQYQAAGDYNQWMYGTNLRFKYSYIPGQWYASDTGPGTWSTLGAGNASAAFIGDGGWHNLNDGWSYSYVAGLTADYGEWKWVAGDYSRFRYFYTSAQWYDYTPSGGATGTWSALGAAGLSSAFVGDGSAQPHDVYNNGTWGYTYDSTLDRAYWRDGTSERFAYDYLAGQWWDNGPHTAGWTQLGAANVASLFIGDGTMWHSLNNGWDFIYTAGAGRWRDSVSLGERFRYDYAGGQWSDLDANAVWTLLGIAGLGSQFIGDGKTYDLGLGVGWTYAFSANNAFYLNGGANRFSYDYGTGYWTDYAPSGTYVLGANLRSSKFIADGFSHDLGTGWFYSFVADEGLWSRTSGGPSRFSYLYSTGQWYDFDSFSNKFALGAAGALASVFMGDEARHEVVTGAAPWWYEYNFATDKGSWAKGQLDPVKFEYRYDLAQWFDIFQGGPYLLGSGMSAAFIGDETAHDLLNNTWKYTYAYTADEGSWSIRLPDGLTGPTRFSYGYTSAVWYHHDAASRIQLGAANPTAQFIGDGAAHDLGIWPNVSGAWWYTYAALTDSGTWSRDQAGAAGPARFAYAYGSGQWSEGNASGLFNMGNAGASAVFIADGVAHDVTTDALKSWWFTYTYGTDTGSWSKSDVAPSRFAYDYTNATWTDNAPVGGAYIIGTGMNASFIGDGSPHALDTVWKYAYDYAANDASWSKIALTDLVIFSYDYDLGQWYHNDAGTPYALGSGGQVASDFIGNGSWHNVTVGTGDIWYYHFNGTQVGQYAKDSLGTQVVFGYDYSSRSWTTYGFGGSTLQLGTLKLDTWVGDGLDHDMGTGWQFAYGYANDGALFSNALYVTQFGYSYATGQWGHTFNQSFYDPGSGAPYNLGNAGNSIANTYYDGAIYTIQIGTLTEKYQFVKGDIGGAADREVGYYYGATGTQAVGPNMAYSYYANGAADGTWALIQKSGTAYLTFTESGLTPAAVNFADGNYHTTFTGQWAAAKFDPTGFGKIYFELSSQDAAVAKEHIYYDLNANQWYDQWNSNGSWYTMTGGMWYGSGNKFMATNLASGNTFAFTQPNATANYLTMWFGDQVTYTHWPNMQTYAPTVLNHIIYETGRGVYDYNAYQARNPTSTPTNPAAAWYLNFSNSAPNNYYAR